MSRLRIRHKYVDIKMQIYRKLQTPFISFPLMHYKLLPVESESELQSSTWYSPFPTLPHPFARPRKVHINLQRVWPDIAIFNKCIRWWSRMGWLPTVGLHFHPTKELRDSCRIEILDSKLVLLQNLKWETPKHAHLSCNYTRTQHAL